MRICGYPSRIQTPRVQNRVSARLRYFLECCGVSFFRGGGRACGAAWPRARSCVVGWRQILSRRARILWEGGRAANRIAQQAVSDCVGLCASRGRRAKAQRHGDAAMQDRRCTDADTQTYINQQSQAHRGTARRRCDGTEAHRRRDAPTFRNKRTKAHDAFSRTGTQPRKHTDMQVHSHTRTQ